MPYLPQKSRKRLYLIGIDSAPVSIVAELSKKHGMKGFEKVIKEGVLADLESTLPPITAAAWPSIYTGLTPGQHGVMNFFYLDKEYNKQLTFYDTERNPPFWDILGEQDLRSLIITPAMVTEPSRNRNVDMITGFPLKPKFSSEQMESMSKKFDFEGEPEIEQDLKDGKITLEQASTSYVESIRKRSEVSKYLIKKNDYDLVFVCFTEADRIQHYSLSLKNWESLVSPLYKEIDKFIEWIIDYAEKSGEDFAIMLVSDHGAQPIKKKILLNSWLISNGYASLSPAINMGGLKVDVSLSNKETSSEGLKEHKYKEQLQTSSKKAVTRFICASVVETDYEDFVNKRTFAMKKTRAFASLSNNPVSNIWANDSRFKEPYEKGDGKEKLIQDIEKGLAELKDEGVKVIAKAHSGKAYYKDTELFISPDIIVEAGKGYTIDVFNHSDESIFAEPEPARRGDHTRYGIFGLYSNSAKADSSGISVLNIAPTIFDYYKVAGKELTKGSRLRK